MKEVGKRFEEVSILFQRFNSCPCHAGRDVVIETISVRSDVKSAGKVVIGTVKGDLHDIGKNLVALMLEGAGFEVKDLGIDVSPEKIY